MSETNLCVVCKEMVQAIDGQLWVEEGPVHNRCAEKLRCPECGGPVGTVRSFVDPFTVPFEVPPGKRNQRWHPYCAVSYTQRETKRAQIEITAAAIVKACQEAPLRELVEGALRAQRAQDEVPPPVSCIALGRDHEFIMTPGESSRLRAETFEQAAMVADVVGIAALYDKGTFAARATYAIRSDLERRAAYWRSAQAAEIGTARRDKRRR